MRDPRLTSHCLAGALAAGLVAGLPAIAAAQSDAPLLASPGGWSASPFIGYARNSPAGMSWGVTPDRDHVFVGVHLATPVLRVGPATLSYAPNLVPLVIVSNNPHHRPISNRNGHDPAAVETGRGPVLGTGLSPLGLQLEFRASSRLRLYGAGAVGGLWFARPVPARDARRFNYTFEWGGGIDVRIDERRAVQLGYKFHHLSNLYTARANPGLDANVFYAGFRWLPRGPRDESSTGAGA